MTGLLIACSIGKDKPTENPEIYHLGTRIDYNIYGEGDTTLLFVHGWCIDQSYWENQVEHFQHRYRVITVDLPGHGNSGKERSEWTIENFGSDISMLINVLDLSNVVLIGHSMGGNIILEAALMKPSQVIAFVGVDNFKEVGLEFTIEQKVEFSEFMSMMRADFQGVAGGFAEGMLFHESTDSQIKERVLSSILTSNPEIAVSILESLITYNERERNQMPRLTMNVNLINSDAIPTDENLLRRYSNNAYKIYSIGHTGHYPMVEKPVKFNQILNDILMNL